MHLSVYIDTNIYLDLLATTSVVTDEMEKFVALCENGSIDIYLPEQTVEEYLSNREDVIARCVRDLQKASSVGALHPLIESHSSGSEAKRLRRELSERLSEVANWYSEAAKQNSLPFDRWFARVRVAAIYIPTVDELVGKATRRAASHLPPGKGEELGDRLIWEALLNASSFCEDLHLITRDNSDYGCPLNPATLRRKLQDEWEEINWGKVYLHGSLSNFLQAEGGTERFARATEIGRAIWILSRHSEPASINVAVAPLQKYIAQLSARQIRLIVAAAKAYSDRVFLTVDAFDDLMSEFSRHYSKILSDSDKRIVEPLLIAAGEISYPMSRVANSN